MLNYYETAKESLFDAIKEEQISKDTKRKLESLKELVHFCDRDEEDSGLVYFVISKLMDKKPPLSKDMTKTLEILESCKRDIVSFISEEFGLGVPISPLRKDEFEKYVSDLQTIVGEEIEASKEQRKKLTQDFVFDHPGLYVDFLTDQLQNMFGEKGFSYSNVLNYVNELTNDEWLTTIGGPQGAYRYCFPNAKKVKEPSKYYGRPFAIEGVIKREVTSSFDLTMANKFQDIYLVNVAENPGNFLLVVNYGALGPSKAITIKSYGDLEPFDYLVSEKRIFPVDTEKTELERHDVLLAKKVAEIVDGKEKEMWTDPRGALLE